jgi:hypothetical protein
MAGPTPVAPMGLARLMTRGGSADTGVDEGHLMSLVGGAVKLGIVAQQLGDCFNKMNTSYDEYVIEAAKPIEQLGVYINKKLQEAKLNDEVANYGRDTPLINQCARALVEQAGYVSGMEKVKSAAKSIVADSCSAENVFTDPALRELSCRQNSMCAWLNGTCILNDYNKRTGPRETKARYIKYDPFTIATFASLQKAIGEMNVGSSGKNLQKIANDTEQFFVDKLFTEMFTRKAQAFPSIAKFLETRPSDGEGSYTNKYLSAFYGNLLAAFAKYLIRKYSLNVRDINSQNTLLAQAYTAYYNADSRDPMVRNTAAPGTRILDTSDLAKLFADFEHSIESTQLFNTHDNHLKQFVY